MKSQTPTWRFIVGAIVCGALVSLATGVIENPPEAWIIGAKYYGYPLVWRVTMITINNSTNFRFTSLALDALFWIIISFLALIVILKIPKRSIKTTSSSTG